MQCEQRMENDFIEQKCEQVREQCDEWIRSQDRVCEGIGTVTQVLAEIDLRQSALEEHVGTTLVECIDEIRIELRRLSDRMDALEGRLEMVLGGELDGTVRRSRL